MVAAVGGVDMSVCWYYLPGEETSPIRLAAIVMLTLSTYVRGFSASEKLIDHHGGIIR